MALLRSTMRSAKKAQKSKKIDSEVAGDADILVAPDIEAANILYKALLHLAGARAAAVILGTSVPLVLTSRADDAATKLASIALASLLVTIHGGNVNEEISK